MIRIGNRILGPEPTLVLALSRSEPILRQSARLGIHVLELRIDAIPRTTPERAARLARRLRRFGLPILATVRSSREGGNIELSEAQRTRFYEEVLPWADAIDIEIASAKAQAAVIAAARRAKKTIVLSHHDFRATPSDARAEALLARARAAGADICKLAATPKSQADVHRLCAFTARHRADNVVCIAMGELGAISRLIFPFFGSLLTYTNVKPSLGQIPLRTLAADLKRYYPDHV